MGMSIVLIGKGPKPKGPKPPGFLKPSGGAEMEASPKMGREAPPAPLEKEEAPAPEVSSSSPCAHSGICPFYEAAGEKSKGAGEEMGEMEEKPEVSE